MRRKKKLLEFLLNDKRRIREVYLLGIFGLYSCGGGGGDGGDGGSSSGGGELKGSLIEGSSEDDVIKGGGTKESLMVSSLDGNDNVETGSESDVVRGGLAKDEIKTGGGNDVILLVGRTGVGEYVEEDVEEVLKSVLGVEGYDSLNNREESEAVSGELIDGGTGEDALVVYGDVDLRGVRIINIEEIRVHSQLILTEEQLKEFKIIRGDGGSELRLESSRGVSVELEMEGLKLEELSGVVSLHLGKGLRLIVSSARGVELLNGFGRIEGEGQVIFRGGFNADGSELTGLELAESGDESYAEGFVEGEQVIVEGAVSGESVGVFASRIIDEVFVLEEGERVVEIGDFDLTGLRLSSSSSALGFVISGGELSVVRAKDYEDVGERSKYYVLELEGSSYVYRVKVLLVDKNEEAVITGDKGGTVREDGEDGGSTFVGTLTLSDEDGSREDYFFTRLSIEGEYGKLSISKEGEWTYYLDNEDLRVQSLGDGETLLDEIVVESVDGTSQSLMLTINGAEEGDGEMIGFEGKVLLSGTGAVGSDLELRLLGVEDLSLSDFSYQWYRGEEEIRGETGLSYTVLAIDDGETISARLTYGELELSSEGVVVFTATVSFTGGALSIEGDAEEGGVLMVEVGELESNGVVVSEGGVSYEYQWYRDEELLEGENLKSYVVLAGDVGSVLKVEVFVIDVGSGEKVFLGEDSSDAIEAVDSLLEGEISIRGEARQGSLLSVDLSGLSDEDGFELSSFIYQWYKDGNELVGGNNRSYLLKDGDVGGSISVRVTVVDKEGNEVEKEADLEGVVMDENDEHTGRVKIDALSIFAGDTITANIDSLSDVDGIDVASYKYQWYVEGEAIESATDSTVVVLGDWSGKKIYVEVRFKDELDNENLSQSVSRGVHNDTDVKILTESFRAMENYAGEIGTLSVSDDSIPGLEFSVRDPLFTIDGDGVLSLALEQDYEMSDGTLSVSLTVRNDNVLTMKEIEVILEDVNDSPEFTTDTGTFTVDENDAGSLLGRSLGVIGAIDQDGDAIRYSVNDLNFLISRTRGELRLLLAQNYEETPELMVTVTIDDGQRESNSTVTKVVTVSIMDVNDMPEFTTDTGGFAIDEHLVSGGTALGRVGSEDEDGDVVVYSVSDMTNFSIDSVMGDLYLLVEQDHELTEELMVTVTINDGQGLTNSLATRVLTITISDVNEEPVFDVSPLVYTIGENRVSGVTPLGIVMATDEDVGTDLLYRVNDVDNFSIDASTGNLYLLVEQDYETMPQLMLTVTADDQGGGIATKVVTVNITDENDVPEFTMDSGSFTILENGVSRGTALGRIGAEDEDGDTIVYSVSDMTNFMIDSMGDLYLVVEQDHESTAELMVTVTIDDGQGLASSMATKVLTITISDVNEEPEFTMDSGSFEINENGVSGGTALGRIGAEDEDGDTIVYSVSDMTNFSIDSVMGDLYLVVEQDYEVVTQLMVTVTIDDGQGLGNSIATKELTVNILDVDDTAPMISGTLEHMRSIAEGEQGVVGTVSADDVDTANGDLIYSTGDTRFDIDVDGRLQVTVDTIDYETISNGTVQVLVTVSDGVRETVQNFDITILDVNDHAPVISSLSNDYQGRTIEEDAGRTKVGEILVTDGDGTAANRVHSFQTGDVRFEVASNGDIFFMPEQISVETLDFMTLITVSDREHQAVSDSITIKVHNTDGVESLLILDQSFNVLENAVGSFMVRATAGTATGSIMYSIGSGNGDGFAITGGGELSLEAKDYEGLGTDKTFSVIVTATSGVDVESATITVTIQDANDVSPEFENTVLINPMSIAEGAGGIVGTISASDDDTVGVLSYSTADTRFSILTQGDLGILSAEAGQIDYEDTSLVSGGTTSVLVTVSDGVEEISLSFEVTVVDVNDNVPTISISPHFNLLTAIEENAGRTLILTAMIFDGDIEAINKQLSLSIDSPYFEIDTIDNKIYFTPEDIFTAVPLEYIARITVSDGFHPAIVETIRVLVNNTDGDLELSIADQGFSVMENMEGSFRILAEAGTASIVYSIEVGNVDGFTILGDTLILGAKDFEGYALGENVLSIMVTVRTDDFEKSATISVTITDENDMPEFSTDSGTFAIEENMVSGGTALGRVGAEDEDGDVVVYSVSDMTNFMIDNMGDLYLLVEQDYETTPELMVTVTIDDGQGLTNSMATKVLTVTIEDENDMPEFSTDSGTFAIEENMVSGGTALGRVGAEDEDGDTIVYSVSDMTNFMIDSMGDLYLLLEQDYELLESLMLTVTIDDGQGLGNSVLTKELMVNILDLDDTAPTISGILEHMRSIAEGTQGVVGTVSADDVDTANSDLVYSTGDMRFDIDGDGRLQVTVDTIDYEMISNGTVSVLVTVSDGVRETMQDFDITILDVNDNAPVISSLVNDYQGLTIEEDAGRTKVGEIVITDGDGTAANRVHSFQTGDGRFEVDADGDIYFTPEQISVETLDFTTLITVSDGLHQSVSESITIRVHNTDGVESLLILDQSFNVLENAVGSFMVRATAGTATGSIMYSIGSGNGDGFAITGGGELSLEAKDYEGLGTDKTFSVIVTATSGVDVESATITVTIQDANDLSPEFESTVLINPMSISEGAGGVVGTISASDDDTVGVLSYSTADTRFNILTQGDLGVLSAEAGQINYEAAEVVDGTTSVLVTVSDGVEEVSLSFEVAVVDENDMPEFSTDSGTFAINENELSGVTALGRIGAEDEDGDTIVYSVSDASNFMIDSMGDLYLMVEQDYELVENIMITVTIDDGQGLGNSVVTKELVVNILDVDDESPVIAGELSGAMSVDEGVMGVVGTVSADDVDTANGDLIYSTGDTRFAIDVDGRLQVAVDTIDYEMISNGTVQVLVTVSDGVRETMESFDITIRDVNDHAPMIANIDLESAYVDGIDEGTGKSLIARVSSTDGDGTAGNRIFMYSTDSADFSVDGMTGDVYFTAPVDIFEMAGLEYMGTITVSDVAHPGEEDSEIVRITVLNTDGVYELEFADQAFTVLENVEGIFVLQADAGTGDIIYSIAGNTDGFAITSGGELSLEAKDYENLGTDKTFSVIVTAATSGGDEESATITVTIEDANDLFPMFENTDLINPMPISEGAGEIVGTISASDGDTVGVLFYSTADTRFSILTQGDLGILRAEEGAIDYEDVSLVSGGTTTVLVTLSDGESSHNQMREYVVTVEDVNESPEIEESLMDMVLLLEGETDKVVGTVRAVDPEGTGILSYSLMDDKFSIDGASGELWVVGDEIDYEDERVVDGALMVTVTVSDGTGSGESSQVFSIRVKDIVEEGMEGVVESLTMLDEDGDGLSYSTEDDRFVIGSDGELRVLANKVDYEDKSLLEGGTTIVIVTVSDGISEVKERVEVSVIDLDDNEFLGVEVIGLVETVDEGMGYTEIGTIVLDDADGPANEVEYILANNMGDMPTYSVDGDGVISFFREFLDNVEYETYSETITVRIGSVEHVVRINTVLNNTDDSGEPIIEAGQEFSVDENVEGVYSLGMVQLLRAEGASPVYSVSDETNFMIDGNGELSIKIAQDRESTESLIVTVTVLEAGVYENSEEVKVLINDLNEHMPVLTAISGVPTENVAEYGTILVGRAMGMDGDADAELTYTVDGERFMVNELGEIRFISLNILEDTQEFEANVTVSDGMTAVSQSLTITVGNDDGIPSDHTGITIFISAEDGDNVVDGHIMTTERSDTLRILNQDDTQQGTYTVRMGRGFDSLTIQNMEINYVVLGVTEAGDYSEEEFQNLTFANYFTLEELNGNTISDLSVGNF